MTSRFPPFKRLAWLEHRSGIVVAQVRTFTGSDKGLIPKDRFLSGEAESIGEGPRAVLGFEKTGPEKTTSPLVSENRRNFGSQEEEVPARASQRFSDGDSKEHKGRGPAVGSSRGPSARPKEPRNIRPQCLIDERRACGHSKARNRLWRHCTNPAALSGRHSLPRQEHFPRLQQVAASTPTFTAGWSREDLVDALPMPLPQEIADRMASIGMDFTVFPAL